MIKKKYKIINGYKVNKINQFSSILKSDAEYFFIDIEETVLAPNIYYKLISSNSFKNIFLDLCKQETTLKIFDIMYYGKNYKRMLMENNIVDIISELKNQNKKVLALTSGFPSHHKKDRILEFNIKFHGYLFTKNKDKGPFLINFLKDKKIIDKKCVFIDNDLKKIINVIKSHCESIKNNKNLDCYLYVKNYDNKVTKEDFIDYWKEVIVAIKNGELQKLRARISNEIKKKKAKYNKNNIDRNIENQVNYIIDSKYNENKENNEEDNDLYENNYDNI